MAPIATKPFFPRGARQKLDQHTLFFPQSESIAHPWMKGQETPPDPPSTDSGDGQSLAQQKENPGRELLQGTLEKKDQESNSE